MLQTSSLTSSPPSLCGDVYDSDDFHRDLNHDADYCAEQLQLMMIMIYSAIIKFARLEFRFIRGGLFWLCLHAPVRACVRAPRDSPPLGQSTIFNLTGPQSNFTHRLITAASWHQSTAVYHRSQWLQAKCSAAFFYVGNCRR